MNTNHPKGLYARICDSHRTHALRKALVHSGAYPPDYLCVIQLNVERGLARVPADWVDALRSRLLSWCTVSPWKQTKILRRQSLSHARTSLTTRTILFNDSFGPSTVPRPEDAACREILGMPPSRLLFTICCVFPEKSSRSLRRVWLGAFEADFQWGIMLLNGRRGFPCHPEV